jgi:hypothetical protein
MTSSSREQRLRGLYKAFNDRDIDTVLSAMAPDVDWPNGWEGGRLIGHDDVRRYWERQWADVRVAVIPTSVTERPDGKAEVRVRQVVRDPTGTVLQRTDVRHVYDFADNLVQRMVVEAS